MTDESQENIESNDWSEYQDALYEDGAWTEDDWYGDWWSDDSGDWSSDWSWTDDSSWNWPSDVPFPPSTQPIAQNSATSSAAKAAPAQAQLQTAAAVIASPPGLNRSDQTSNNSKGSGIARSSRPALQESFSLEH